MQRVLPAVVNVTTDIAQASGSGQGVGTGIHRAVRRRHRDELPRRRGRLEDHRLHVGRRPEAVRRPRDRVRLPARSGRPEDRREGHADRGARELRRPGAGTAGRGARLRARARGRADRHVGHRLLAGPDDHGAGPELRSRDLRRGPDTDVQQRHPDRRRHQPRELRRTAREHAGSGRGHQLRRRRQRAEHRLRDRDRFGEADDRRRRERSRSPRPPTWASARRP